MRNRRGLFDIIPILSRKVDSKHFLSLSDQWDAQIPDSTVAIMIGRKGSYRRTFEFWMERESVILLRDQLNDVLKDSPTEP